MIRYSPVARAIPARTACPLPPFFAIRRSVTPGSASTIAAVPSFEQSSTTMISFSSEKRDRSTALICFSSVPMNRSSL